MKVIKPQTFNSATTLVSTSAVETLSNWAAGTYALNAKVLHPLTVNGVTFKYQWTSLVANNTATPGTDATKWLQGDVGNKDAMFDGQVNVSTTGTSPLTVTIRAPLANSVGFVGLVGSQLVVTVNDNGANPAVYTRTVNLDGSIIVDFYMYFFEPFVQLGEVVLTDLPPYLQGQITMALTSGSPVEVGEMVWGTSYVLSDKGIEQGASVSIIDYSRKDTDADTGRTTFTRRAFSKRMSGQFMVANDRINSVQRILADLRAVPSVYIGSEDAQYAPLVVYGFYRDFSIDIAYPTTSLCRIEVEGLI